ILNRRASATLTRMGPRLYARIAQTARLAWQIVITVIAIAPSAALASSMPIQVDGEYGDWTPTPFTVTDPAGDGGGSPPPPPAVTDGDGDGIPDADDRCPTTFGTGADGCPVVTPPSPPPADGDGDGVPDAADRCPTTFGTGSDGCPVVEPPPVNVDTDGDGVPDTADACPDVAGAGADGCPVVSPPPPPPVDTDGDGVPDTVDLCANTPLTVSVDANGCPVDGDGDGVPDYLDACPTQAGAGADGCPVITPSRPAILGTSCVGCHGDRSNLVSCSSSGWRSHNGSKGITAAQYQEVTIWATGGTCQ
ncbi:MAG: thrombospondin type 3 repeat-containing protein, partial [Proteobacteria bacterium]|nr:thrombospondin type 3 repeat-containing protein [Pseudomonadota bacterium]